MNKIIIPTGYMGSGSSAITDILSEFESYRAKNGSFEYVFMHCPGGIFDLEDKLLIGNNAVRSDEALHTFYKTMTELYNDKLWWPANYKKKIGQGFMDATEEYIKDLIQYTPDTYWYMQEKYTFSVFFKMCLRKLVSLITNNKIVMDRPLIYKPMWISLVNDQEFYEITQKYLRKIFIHLGIEKNNLILDQLILPFNLNRVGHYFDENVECFVVERDPRDVFISNKYVWAKKGENVPYPTEAKTFCKYYKRLRNMEKGCVHNEHIHRINFEDLIYHYDEMIEKICSILHISSKEHDMPKKYFNPQKSINNTQLFLKQDFCDEMSIIEKELKEYLYRFPYQRTVDMEKIF